MINARQSTLAFRCSGWFALLLLVAYVVYLPVHLATETHCLPGTAHVHDCDHHAHHDHEHNHHHSADEHDLNATGKQDTQLSMIFLSGEVGFVIPTPADSEAFALRQDDLPPDRTPVRSLPSRAPPLA